MTEAKRALLLVDDDESNRLTLCALLEDEGYDVSMVESVESAEVVLADRTRSFGAVILDFHLGDRIGTDLLPTIRTHLPRAAVIVMSGTGFDAPVEGAQAVLSKGEDFTILRDCLDRLTGLTGTGSYLKNPR